MVERETYIVEQNQDGEWKWWSTYLNEWVDPTNYFDFRGFSTPQEAAEFFSKQIVQHPDWDLRASCILMNLSLMSHYDAAQKVVNVSPLGSSPEEAYRT
jgi:hypothetical protein